MEHRIFGATDRQVPVIGQGTWYGQADRRETVAAALLQGLDLGMTHIDTAEMYLSGRAERWVGEAIAGRREEVFLVSKVLPQNASRRGTVEACERSLARLGTDRLDCYLLHWRSGDHPLAETIEAFDQLQREQKILSWGVSNFDVGDLKDAHHFGGGRGPVCNQVLYHVQERAVEHAVIPWCEGHQAALVAYSPFGHGNFPPPQSPGGRLLQKIADVHGATPRQVVLRFLLRWRAAFAIPKSSHLEHIAENAAAGDLHLTETQIASLEKQFPRGPVPQRLPML